MLRVSKVTHRFAALTATLLASAAAAADLAQFNIYWDGSEFGNTATATGQVTIDLDLIPNPGSFAASFDVSPFSEFTITIVGADSGNGTFTSAGDDFAQVSWNTTDPMDFTSELVEQRGFIDFNLFARDTNTGPTGIAPGYLVTGGAQSDGLRLMSITPAPPPCLADLTGDGDLNFFDVSAFLSAFGAGDLLVDFNGDGFLNFFDVSAFLTIFADGCP